jgi:hypothetical protein
MSVVSLSAAAASKKEAAAVPQAIRKDIVARVRLNALKRAEEIVRNTLPALRKQSEYATYSGLTLVGNELRVELTTVSFSGKGKYSTLGEAKVSTVSLSYADLQRRHVTLKGNKHVRDLTDALIDGLRKAQPLVAKLPLRDQPMTIEVRSFAGNREVQPIRAEHYVAASNQRPNLAAAAVA